MVMLIPSCAVAADPPPEAPRVELRPPPLPRLRIGLRVSDRAPDTEIRVQVDLIWRFGRPALPVRLRTPRPEAP